MKRFRNVSAIVSLSAGFITAVVMLINRYELLTFIWILASVLVAFYIVSRIICFVCDRHITKEEEKAEENTVHENTVHRAMEKVGDLIHTEKMIRAGYCLDGL